MTMDDAEYDAVAAAITKALLEQEIKELLEEHEKMDDTDDNDALLLDIVTLGLVCIVVVATCPTMVNFDEASSFYERAYSCS